MQRLPEGSRDYLKKEDSSALGRSLTFHVPVLLVSAFCCVGFVEFALGSAFHACKMLPGMLVSVSRFLRRAGFCRFAGEPDSGSLRCLQHDLSKAMNFDGWNPLKSGWCPVY